MPCISRPEDFQPGVNNFPPKCPYNFSGASVENSGDLCYNYPDIVFTSQFSPQNISCRKTVCPHFSTAPPLHFPTGGGKRFYGHLRLLLPRSCPHLSTADTACPFHRFFPPLSIFRYIGHRLFGSAFFLFRHPSAHPPFSQPDFPLYHQAGLLCFPRPERHVLKS